MPFYAVKIGRKRGIYRSWIECQAQISGLKNANWRVFTLLEDAKIFLEKGTGTLIPLGAAKPTAKEIRVQPIPAKKIEIDPEMPALMKPETTGIKKEEIEEVEKVKEMEPNPKPKNKYGTPLHVYCVSVAKKNKKTEQRGSYSIFFGAGDERNRTGAITEKMDSYKRNLYALTQAFRSLPLDAFKYKDVVLNSDDKFAVQACVEWVQGWKKYGWKTLNKTPVQHRELIKSIDQSLKFNKNVSIEYVRSDSDHLQTHLKNNEQALQLAKKVHYRPKKTIFKITKK